ncbi:MAG: VWA domain-containing protein [Victivallaceae bacterium]|nr:VWA domain-containing protein [Victivallaceae bacterium]
MFSFAYPYLLLLELLIPAVWYFIVRYRRSPSLLMPSAAPFAAAEPARRRRLPGLPDMFYLAALAVLLFALAQPRWGTEHFAARSEGVDIMLAVDLSGSMMLFDVPRNVSSRQELVDGLNEGRIGNRMEVSKEALSKFVTGRPNDRFGLIGFAESAYSFVPPTLDHNLVLDNLRNFKPGMLMTTNTGIASPIIAATLRLSKSSSPRRVLVLFTDGVNNVDHTVTPLEAAELAKAKDVIIYTVGLGSDNSFAIEDGVIRPASSSFDEPLLKDIAKITGGRYFHASDEDGLNQAMGEINQLEKTSAEQHLSMSYRHWAPDLALAAMLLVLAGFMLECTVRLRLP